MGEKSKCHPVHDNIRVLDAVDIYKSSEWWKAVIYYENVEYDSDPEVGIYLWHYDGGDNEWKRKNKYTIKSAEAWKQDLPIINALLNGDEPKEGTQEEPEDVPVSDYYTVEEAYTVFRSEDWWKGIIRITEKGDYETEEIIVYLWGLTEDGWHRRQKYAIKEHDDWEKERKYIEAMFQENPAETTEKADDNIHEPVTGESNGSISDSLDTLNEELKEHHLSTELEK